MAALLTQVRTSVSIHAHRRVRGLLEGEYAAMTSGRSLDFNDLREYVRGDDAQDIDWKASARSPAPLVRRYVALRQHSVVLVVSTGRSMAALNDVGTVKRDLAVLVAGVVGWLAVRHGDTVATAHGDAATQHVSPGRRSEIALERCLREIHEATRTDAPHSDLNGLLRHAIRTIRRRSILVVVHDEPELTDEVLEALRRLAAQHEVLVVTIGDLDPTSAVLGDRQVVDIDTGVWLSPGALTDATVRTEYAAILRSAMDRTTASLDRLGVVHERVHDDDSAITAVFRLLERHRHARRR